MMTENEKKIENEENEVWIKAKEEKEVMTVGIFRRLHPQRILNGIMAFFLGKRGYCRIILIDGNYQGHEKIVKLENEIKIGKRRHVLDPKPSIQWRGLTTYCIHSDADRPIDLRGGAGGDAQFLEYLVEKASLAGQSVGVADLEKIKKICIVTLAMVAIGLYFLYRLVEVGI